MLDVLKETIIFNRLTNQEIDKILKNTKYEIKRYEAG